MPSPQRIVPPFIHSLLQTWRCEAQGKKAIGCSVTVGQGDTVPLPSLALAETLANTTAREQAWPREACITVLCAHQHYSQGGLHHSECSLLHVVYPLPSKCCLPEVCPLWLILGVPWLSWDITCT